MIRLSSILTIFLLASCSSKYDKLEVTKYLEELKELNQVLLNHTDRLEWQNDPMCVSSEIPQTQNLIELLIKELNLSEIEFHRKIKGKADHLGLAYRFGDPKTEKNYSFLIFTQNEGDLESFRHYEQFLDCGKPEPIQDHWAFSRIIVNCNDY
jgi:hypothetical protein